MDNLNISNEKQEDLVSNDVDLNNEDDNLDELEVYIQANLEDEVIKEALKQDVDLRNYSRQVEQKLNRVEKQYINDYVNESKNIASLHKQINSCDSILQIMEDMLRNFQKDLNNISSEIQHLQEESINMNIKLRNEQEVKGLLSQYIDELIVHHHLIKVIMEGNVSGREFLEQLHELNIKIKFVQQQKQKQQQQQTTTTTTSSSSSSSSSSFFPASFHGIKAINDIIDVLDKLKYKSIEKIRNFILIKINSFKKPMTNYQIPQNYLLKFRFFNEFLQIHETSVAMEIKNVYIDTVSKIYFSYFKSYFNRLIKLQDDIPDKEDLMGVEDTAKKSFFTNRNSAISRSNVFSLGSRGQLLAADIESAAILAHSTEKYNFENIYRSITLTLVDNFSREYFFIQDFFSTPSSSSSSSFSSSSSSLKNETIIQMFMLIFGRIINHYTKQIDQQVMASYDGLMLFICLQLTFKFQKLFNSRCPNILDNYFKEISDLFTDRLIFIIQNHVTSLKNSEVFKSSQIIDTRPHYITRRYAEFSSAIYSLSENPLSDKLTHHMTLLQVEINNLIKRLSRQLQNNKQQQLTFLINNYDLIITISMEKLVNEWSNKQLDNFRELLISLMKEYTDLLIFQFFSEVMTLVREAEERENNPNDQFNSSFMGEKQVSQIIRKFNSNWRENISQINQSVMSSFPNFKISTQIIQGALTQLIQWYHRLSKIFSFKPYNSFSIKSEMLNTHSLMVEVKKHKPNF